MRRAVCARCDSGKIKALQPCVTAPQKMHCIPVNHSFLHLGKCNTTQFTSTIFGVMLTSAIERCATESEQCFSAKMPLFVPHAMVSMFTMIGLSILVSGFISAGSSIKMKEYNYTCDYLNALFRLQTCLPCLTLQY